MSWKNVLVVRPQPGQAVTCGVKLRSPSDLQNLLGDDDFVGAVAIGQRRERGANGVADAFLQQHRKRGGGRDDAFRSEAGFGQSEMQRVVALGGQLAIDHDQILHAADLGAEDDLVAAESIAVRRPAAASRPLATMAFIVTSLASSGSGRREFSSIMRVSSAPIERAPVDADAHRAIVLDGGFDHGAEIVVVLLADVDVAGIDAVLGEGAGAVGILLQQEVAVVVEVADDGDADAEFVERVDDFGHGRRRLRC